jgi:hypothetical protein
MTDQADFDVASLFAALDTERQARGLSWSGVARELWEQSHLLNDRRRDHLSPATLTNIAKRQNTSCQHALFVLRWLGRSPESFVAGAKQEAPLPSAGPDRRLRWNLRALHAALDEQRRERGLTWAELARELDCTPSQLTGLRSARFATGMRLAMRIGGWLEVPAADFVYVARW